MPGTSWPTPLRLLTTDTGLAPGDLPVFPFLPIAHQDHQVNTTRQQNHKQLMRSEEACYHVPLSALEQASHIRLRRFLSRIQTTNTLKQRPFIRANPPVTAT